MFRLTTDFVLMRFSSDFCYAGFRLLGQKYFTTVVLNNDLGNDMKHYLSIGFGE